MRALIFSQVFLAILLFVGPAGAGPGDGHWDRQFNMPGTATRNFALRFNGTSLYTGGYSLFSGQVATNTVVNVFDGTNWSTIGEISGGTCVLYDFAFLGSDVYVGGVFTKAGGVSAVGLAKWDGANWSSVGGFAGLVFAIANDGTNLYVGGSFTNVGGTLSTNIARWNGTNWSALGGGVGDYQAFIFPSVNALALHNGELYAGGSFTNAGTSAATNLARWDGNTWSQVGGGVAGVGSIFSGPPVSSLQFLGDDLYVGGSFTTVGGNVPALNVARWDGATWWTLGTGLKGPPNSAPVNALAFLGPDLYAAGNFTNAGGIATTRVAKWDGGTWSALGGLNDTGIRAVSNSGSIYIAGLFNGAASTIGNHIIRWDGANWFGVSSRPGQGTHIFVQGLGLGNAGLYMGGFFSVVGTTIASRIARWDGTNWFALGDGLTASFSGSLVGRAIKARNNEVYVGGDFSSAGGVLCTNIAMWDGISWWPLAYGFDETVSAIDVSPTDVYAGGTFTNAYLFPGFAVTVNHIARWDGGNWWPLGSGVNGLVGTIYVAGSDVYVGGSFTTAGGATANRIARWDGANWFSLGTGTANGVGGTVSAILVDGTDVYAGGQFTTAGGATARAIAKWDGNTWSPLGQGMFSTSTAAVRSLAKIGSYLYAAGTFTNAGGVLAHSIARWDGAKWEALGSGIGNLTTSPRGNAMVAWGNDLFVGGIFEDAGVNDSGYIARWNDQIDFTPPSVMRLSNPQMLPGNAFKFRATATERATYVVEHSADLANWTPLLSNSVSPLEITNSAAGSTMRAFRLRQIP